MCSSLFTTDNLFYLFTGGFCGTVAALATSPIEVLKVRLQVSHNEFYLAKDFKQFQTLQLNKSRFALLNTNKYFVPLWHNRFVYTLLKIRREEGLRGFYKGLGPTLLGTIPSRAIYFVSYENAKSYLSANYSGLPMYAQHLSAAAVSAFTCHTLTNPIWMIKTRLQIDSNAGEKKLSARQVCMSILREKGVHGLYRGVTASYFGIFETMVNWTLYEHLKMVIRERSAAQKAAERRHLTQSTDTHTHSDAHHADELADEHTDDNAEHERNPEFRIHYVLASATSKSIAILLFFPHDLIRVRLREPGSEFRGFFDAFAQIYRREGWRALYRGMPVHYCRTMPFNVITLTLYDWLINLAYHNGCLHLRKRSPSRSNSETTTPVDGRKL